MKLKTIVFIVVGLVLFFGTIYGYALEIPYFGNTFNILHLVSRGAGAGGIVGLLFGFGFLKRGMDGIERFQAFALCVIAGALVGPLVANWVNHSFGGETRTEKVGFVHESGLITNRFGMIKNQQKTIDFYYTEFIRDGERQRIRSNHPLFKGVEQGATIDLPTRKGYFGFDFVPIQ